MWGRALVMESKTSQIFVLYPYGVNYNSLE